MKKMYITPAVEINETMTCQMMALSIIQGTPADGSDALGKEENNWDVWSSDED